MTETGPDGARLIARCVAGDDAAKAEFLGEYGALLKRAIAQKLAGLGAAAPVRGEVDDIHADLLARLLDHNCRMLRTVKDADRIHAWLTVVARRHTVDYLRRWSSRMRTQTASLRETSGQTYESPADAAISKETALEVRRHIAALSPAQRIAVELYYIHEMSYADIAAITSQSINTVASHLRRGKAHLRERLLNGQEALHG